MSKREKVIVALAVFALLYAGYVFFPSPQPKRIPVVPESRSNLLNQLVTEVTRSISKETLSEKEAYIMTRVLTPWREDLFQAPYRDESEGIGEKILELEPFPEDMDLVYSGYLEMGSKRIAIISGMEYQVGETLKPQGLIVRAIHPNRIIIEIKEHGRRITLPLKEETP